jgi:hypothetical protein
MNHLEPREASRITLVLWMLDLTITEVFLGTCSK